MSKQIFLFVCFAALISACKTDKASDKNDTVGKRISNDENLKEKRVLSYLQENNLLFLNDTAKWYLYNIYCDDTVTSEIANSSTKVFLSNLQLKPAFCGYSQDSTSLDIYYRFFYNDSTPITHIDTKYHIIVDGVSFDIKTHKLTGFIRGHGGHFIIKGSDSRFINPVQPEVVSFVKQNEDNLNDWYRDALIKHGIKLD